MALMPTPGTKDLLPPPAVGLQPTVVGAAPHDSSDTLAFYLTRHLDISQDKEILRQLEEPIEDFQKRIRYYSWPHEEDGTLEDVERLAYGTSVKHDPHESHCILFIDRQSAEDDTVLIVECVTDPEEQQLAEGSIVTRGRMAAKFASAAIVNSDLANMYLIEYMRSNVGEWNTTLQFHHERHEEEDEKEDEEAEEDAGRAS